MTMADLEKLKQNLQKNGFEVTHFATAAQAADYLDGQIDGKTVGVGGSITVLEMGLAERLRTHNTLHWHWTGDGDQAAAATCQVYLSSVNGAAETGELINIDGNGNRVAALIYGPQRVIVVAGVNKIVRNLEEAISRVKYVAAPANGVRLGTNTPCSHTGRCAQCEGGMTAGCASEKRMCCQYVVTGYQRTDRIRVVLVGEELGY